MSTNVRSISPAHKSAPTEGAHAAPVKADAKASPAAPDFHSTLVKQLAASVDAPVPPDPPHAELRSALKKQLAVALSAALASVSTARPIVGAKLDLRAAPKSATPEPKAANLVRLAPPSPASAQPLLNPKPVSTAPATAPLVTRASDERPAPLLAAARIAPLLPPAALEDPGLRLSLLGKAAHVSLDSGQASAVDLHIRVRDGIADIRLVGTEANLLSPRSHELSMALKTEGLSLGSLDLSQRQSSDARPEASPERPSEAPRAPMSHPGANIGAPLAAPVGDGIHVKA